MNEQTAAIVSTLAAKLGTTSEYLWSVLLKQAPITAWITLAEYGLTAVFLFAFFKYRAAISGTWRRWVEADECTGIAGLIVGCIVLTSWLLACVFSFDGMLTAFLNPEYWALNKVLSAVKSK